jgi:hypothetical protein
LTLVVLGGTLAGCGAKTAAGPETSRANPGATATYAVALTQVAEAKRFVATATADAKAAKPTATATPRVDASPEATATPDIFADVSPSPNFEGDVLALLPVIEDLPEGYALAGEGPLTAELIASAYNDQAGFLQKLERWGYRQGATRAFGITRPTPDQMNTRMVVFNTAVIEFGSPEQSIDSMQANREYVKKGIIGDPPNVTLECLGDFAIAVQGEVFNSAAREREQWAFIWVQKGNLVLYYRAMSLGYVPMEEAIQIVTASLSR